MIHPYRGLTPGLTPGVHPAAFVEASAHVIGDVALAEQSSMRFRRGTPTIKGS